MTRPAPDEKAAAAKVPPARRDWRTWLRRRWHLALGVVGVVVASAGGYLVGERRMTADRSAALADIDTYTSVLLTARTRREDRPKLDARLQSVVDRTLGGSLETVDSEVRRRLNRVCEELGMTSFSVTTGATTARGTPARKEFNRPSDRALRDEPDFVEVQATVNASGSVKQIYGLLFRIAAEPWDKRVESIRLDPNPSGEEVRAVIRLGTMFLPGRSGERELVLDPDALASVSRYAALLDSNPFRIPPPPTAPTNPSTTVAGTTPNGAGVTPPATDIATGFPYGEWQLTGLVEGPAGAEAWLRHLTTGAQLTVLPGTQVGELVFRKVEYDFAVFDGPTGPCRIQVGDNLTQRS